MSYVALLRGINVGGKNKLAMKDLAAAFEEIGCKNVRTYIQSGNVVYGATAAVARRAAADVTALLAARFGIRSPIVVRSAEELAHVVAESPFVGADPKTLHVAFLAHAPPSDAIAALDPERSPPDELVVRGADIHLRLPNGVARTKLTNDYLDRTLRTTSTIRNWKTGGALRALATAT